MIFFGGCNVDKNQNLKYFRYNAGNKINSLDPVYARTQDDIWACKQLFNGLVQLDTLLIPQPCIAKKWAVDSNGLRYVFTLREDVFFHSNADFKVAHRVMASDFVYSFNRLLDPKTASPGRWVFQDKIAKNGFKAPNDSTLIIELKKPFAPLLSILSMPYAAVVPKYAIDKYGKEFGRNPIGTGPFDFYFWEDEVKLILKKNKNYFEVENGISLPKIDGVIIQFMENKQAEFLSLLQGKIDMLNGLESSYINEVINVDGSLNERLKKEYYALSSPFLNTEFLSFYLGNEAEVPLEIRKAINLAIDREKIIQHLRNGQGNTEISGFVPPSLLKAPVLESYNPKLSKELVLNMKGKWNETLELQTTKDYADIALLIQKQLKNVGLICTIAVLPSSELKDKKSKGQLNFFRGSWIADYPDAENYFACFYSPNFSPGGPNYSHFKSPEFDKLYEKCLVENNLLERQILFLKMNALINEKIPVVVLFYDQSFRLLSKRVKNMHLDGQNGLRLKHVELE